MLARLLAPRYPAPMLRAAGRLIPPTEAAPEAVPPPGLAAFHWHFIRQATRPCAAMSAVVGLVAVLDTLVPFCMGRLVTRLAPIRARRCGPMPRPNSPPWPR